MIDGGGIELAAGLRRSMAERSAQGGDDREIGMRPRLRRRGGELPEEGLRWSYGMKEKEENVRMDYGWSEELSGEGGAPELRLRDGGQGTREKKIRCKGG